MRHLRCLLAWVVLLPALGCSGNGDDDDDDDGAAENTVLHCSDDIDNDGDGHVDCDDQDCEIFAICVIPIDAAPPDAPIDAPIDAAPFTVDVTGQFLFGISLGFAPAPEATVRMIGDLAFTIGGAPVLDMSLQPLTIEEGTMVGDPIVANDVPVTTDGTFDADIEGNDVDGSAGPTGSDFSFTAVMHGQILGPDLLCGTLEGMVTEPSELALDGTTFAAIRITPGTIGGDLPTAVVACPD